MTYDFTGLTRAQMTLLSFQGWDRYSRMPPKPRASTVKPLIDRGLIQAITKGTGRKDVAAYVVPIAVHAAWCAHCAKG